MTAQSTLQKSRRYFSETDRSMATTFKVLSDVNRYRIFNVLIHEPKSSVGTIAEILNIPLPLASSHLKVLEQARLVQKPHDGKKIYPQLEQDNPLVQTIMNMMHIAKIIGLSHQRY